VEFPGLGEVAEILPASVTGAPKGPGRAVVVAADDGGTVPKGAGCGDIPAAGVNVLDDDDDDDDPPDKYFLLSCSRSWGSLFWYF